MIPQATLQKIANAKKVRDKQIEKDYILSWILHGLSQESFLKNNLVFKGGTALKKFYFQDYRFSEDLDFTLIDSSIKPEEIISRCKQIFSYISHSAPFGRKFIKTFQMQLQNTDQRFGSRLKVNDLF